MTAVHFFSASSTQPPSGDLTFEIICSMVLIKDLMYLSHERLGTERDILLSLAALYIVATGH